MGGGSAIPESPLRVGFFPGGALRGEEGVREETGVKVADEEAFDAAQDLARREGIVADSSSGAALSAALRAIRAGLRGNVVVLFPDRGDRYFSKGLFTAD